jgi:hypothetical protein
MSTRALLLLVALAAMLVAIFIVLQPDDEGAPSGTTPSTDEVESDGNRDLTPTESTPAATDVDPASAGIGESAQRDEVQSGHRVLVLDVDGTPLPGAQVWLREIRPDLREDLLSYWAANPDKLRPWGLLGQGSFAWTDETGVAQFELRDAASAGVVLAEAMGAISFPAIPVGGAAEPNIIQLVAMPSIEVLVLDASDQPVVGKEVRLRLSSAQDLVGLDGEARLMRRSQGGPWLGTRVEVVSDSEGRALLPIFVTKEERESLGQAEYWIGEASLEVPAYETVRSEFALPRTEPVVLRLPAMGSLDLRLVAYPPGVIPQLIDVEGRGEDMSVPTEDSVSGKFRFDDLIVGQQYRVFFFVEHRDAETGERESMASTHLPEEVIEGPVLGVDLTERTLRYERIPGLYGRFVLPEHRREAVKFSKARDFTARGIAERLSLSAEKVWLNVFADGSFHVSPTSAHYPGDIRSLSEVHTIAFEWWSRSFSWANPGSAIERRTLFASVPIKSMSDKDAVELGEVFLEEEPFLLHITTRDIQGNPVPGVSVYLACLTNKSVDGELARNSWSAVLYTDDQGEVWVQDIDWYTEFAIDSPDSQAPLAATIQEVVVTARHGEYAAVEKRIPLDQRELEMVLEQSGSAKGSYLPCAGLNEMWIVWLPVGAPLEHDFEGAVCLTGTLQSSMLEGGESFEFNCSAIPEGQWDVVFSVGSHRGHEALRVPAVEIHGGEVSRDPRLQNVDLNDLVTIHRAEFRTEDGAPVTPPNLQGRLKVQVAPDLYLDRQFRWNNGGINFAEPLGVPLEGFITDDNWLSIDLRTLSAGENRVTVYPRRDQAAQAMISASLTEGIEWSLTLECQVPPQGSQTVNFDRDGRGTVKLPAAGQYILSWAARVQGERVTSESSTRNITLAELTGDAAITFLPPTSFLEQVRAKVER